MSENLRFDNFQLDLNGNRLLRDGEVVALRPQSFDVLAYLATNGGRLVTKEELLEAVWPGRVVTDDSVSHCIADIRAALEDSGREKIRTVPRRGFVFQMEVNMSGAKSAPPLRQTTPLAVTILVLAMAAVTVLAGFWFQGRELQSESVPSVPPPSVKAPLSTQIAASGAMADPAVGQITLAVLPFDDLSESNDQGHMADGLTEELIMGLVQVPGLQVVGRTSAFRFKDHSSSLQETGAALGVSHVVEGSVRRSGDQWRITAQLVEVTSGVHLWSDSYDRPVDDFFAIQDEITDSVLAALLIRLGVSRDWANPYATDSIEAYERVRKALEIEPRTAAEAEVALEHLRVAVELDPEYGFAWGVQASIYSTLGDALSENWREASDRMIQRSIALSSGSPWPRYNAAMIYARLGEFVEAGRMLQAAEDQSGYLLSLPRIDFILKMGRVSDALAMSRRAVIRDPLDFAPTMYLAQTLASAGEFDEALKHWDALMTMEAMAPDMSSQAFMTALASGDASLIVDRLQRARALNPDNQTFEEAQRYLDQPEQFREWVRTQWTAENHVNGEGWYRVNIAAWLGETDTALEMLERDPDSWSIWMDHFATVRSTPRFHQWIRNFEIDDYWRENGFADACEPVDEEDFRCQ